MPKIYSVFPGINNNKTGNFYFNLNWIYNTKLEKSIGTIPFRKDVGMENNNND